MNQDLECKDRRKRARFPLERELRYKLLEDNATVCAGVGRTIDISSNGVSFLGEHGLAPGAFVELSIGWPVLLNDECPMRLIVFGRVIRSTGFTTACSIDKYEFRTQARSARENPIPIRNDATTLRRWAETVRGKLMEARATA